MSRKEQIKQMLDENPDDTFLQYAYALEIGKENKIEQAINQVEKLLDKSPNYLGAYYQLGQWYETIEKFDKAMEIYAKGIELASNQNNTKTKGELEQALWLIE